MHTPIPRLLNLCLHKSMLDAPGHHGYKFASFAQQTSVQDAANVGSPPFPHLRCDRSEGPLPARFAAFGRGDADVGLATLQPSATNAASLLWTAIPQFVSQAP